MASRPTRLRLHDCLVDLEAHQVVRGEQRATLTLLEGKLLTYLVTHVGRPVPASELLVEVWGYASSVRSAAVKKAIHRLRAKIEASPADPTSLLTVAGRGYRLELPGASAPPHSRGLRPERTRLIGRADAVRRAQRLLDEHRLVTIVGHAGAGKTRLAHAIARAAAETGAWSAVCAVDLAEASSVTDIRRALQQGLGSEGGNVPSLSEHGRLLLLLDNFEQVVEHAAATVSHWLDDTSELTVLVTSRTPLQLMGEYRWVLPPLSQDAALQLLVRRAEAAGTRIEPDSAARELVRRLDALPLALEMAASQLGLLSTEELLSKLTLNQLTLGEADRPARHASLRSALQESWRLLRDRQRQILSSLATFRGGFDLDAALAVSGATVSELQELVDRSLLHHPQPDRLALYEGLRMLASEETSSRASDAHASYFAQRTQRHPVELAWLSLEHSNLRAAMRHVDDLQEVSALAVALFRLLEVLGVSADDQWIFDRASDYVHADGPCCASTPRSVGW